MLSPAYVQLVIFGVLLLISAILYWRTNGKVTPEQLSKAAQMAVMAAEQYKNTGQLKTNDEQLEFAINFVKQLLPAANAIPDGLIINAIHAFVPAANAITAQIEAAWPNDAPPSPATLPDGTQKWTPTLGNMG